MAERPSETASRPGDCGVSSSRDVSAPRTISASASSAGSSIPYSLRKASKLHSSPSCENGSASGMSYAVALVSAATVKTRSVGTNRNRASGSMKRRISQGQAMRSILGRSRVNPPVRPRGELATTGQPELGPTRDAMFEETSVGPGCAERRCSILADFPPVSTIDDDGTPLGQLAAPIINLCGKPTDRTDDYRVVSLESRAPDIDDDRRQLCTEPGIESLRRNRKTVL